MAIKIQGNTIIDDTRVLVNTGNIGVGTDNPSGAADPNNTTIVNAGIVTANFFYGDGSNLTGISAGGGGLWESAGVGIVTTTIVGVNTTTVTGAASSEGVIQAYGNVAIVDGALLTDTDIDGPITIPAGKNGLLIGPATVSVGATINVSEGSVLVVV